jgi:demethylmenaquinone methyltransferase/2-methoxy-6-polyprenyl-1,4-benzoquinol methylase
MHRVLRKGGKVSILEFSQPVVFPIKQLYSFYFRFVLPLLGSKISADSSAYSYLPESVYAFPDKERFLTELEKIGFRDGKFRALTFGIVCIYTATK